MFHVKYIEMGGGGFMNHASDTNRKNKAQKIARREKFNGNFSEKSSMNNSCGQKLDFSHLSDDDISKERNRIATNHELRRNKIFKVVWFLVITILIASTVLSLV